MRSLEPTVAAGSRGASGFLVALLMALLALGWSAGAALAQDPPNDEDATEEAADTTELVFEREVFAYPEYQRRNPFRPLTEADTGPRFEDLRLLGVIVADRPERSLALVAVGSGSGDETHRLRAGDTLGSVRFVEVREREVVVEIADLGEVHRRTLRVERSNRVEPGDVAEEAAVDDDGDDPGEDSDGEDSDENPPSDGDPSGDARNGGSS